MILTVDSDHPQPGVMAQAASIIRQGGVVVFPTRTLYGLAADAFNREAVARIFHIKRRAEQNPLLILIREPSPPASVVTHIPPAARLLMTRFWPGGVTLVMPAHERLPREVTAGTGTIGVRRTSHPVAAALVEAVGGPITGTSANLSGEPGYVSCPGETASFATEVDLMLDAGPLAGGVGSTVVDVTVTPPKILREGTIPREDIRKTLLPC